MKQALAALLGGGLTLAACIAAGMVLLRLLKLTGFIRRGERWPLALTLGASVLHLVVLGVLAAQAAYWPVLLAVLVFPLLRAVTMKAWRPVGAPFGPTGPWLKWIAGVPAAVFTIVYFVYAWSPEHSPDGSTYHLGFVARYLRTHGLEKITVNFYAMLSQGVELLFLPAFSIGRHSSAALVHLGFGVALAWAIFQFGRRQNMPWVGAAAALLTFLAPVFGLTASIAYIDVAAAAIVFSTFYWLELWDQEHGLSEDSWRLLIPVGLMAGYAIAAKLTVFTIAVYALAFVALRARRIRPLLIVTAGIALMAGPWIARNWIWYQNPMAPLGTAVFRNPYTHVTFEEGYREYLTHYEVTDMSTLPMEVTLGGLKTQGIVGPVFLLLPIGLLALRRRAGRHIWIAALLLLSTYPANIGTRFLIPALPFLSLAITMAIGEQPRILAALILIHAALSWPKAIPLYASEYAWRIDRFPWREALRRSDTETFLRQTIGGYNAARLVNAKVPEDASVLTFAGIPDAYTRPLVRVLFQSASNEVAADIFYMGTDIGQQPIRLHRFRFAPRTGRRFRMLQTASNVPHEEQWNVHELRFYHNGMEIARRPEWRLQAWPNPWDVQMAFDNSPVTRWRSWETPAPGMYLDVDFGGEETVDEIRVATSADSIHVRMEPQMMTVLGAWEGIPAQLESSNVAPVSNARRLATYEMHRRGVDYILLNPNDPQAEDVANDPEAWGLRELGEDQGARLYKTIWPQETKK